MKSFIRWRGAWACFVVVLLFWGSGLFFQMVFPVSAFAAQEEQHQDTEKCVSNYDKNKDYFPKKLTVDYAEGFQVSYHKHYKKVKVVAPWKKGGETFEYLLVQCGTPTPKGFEHA